MNFVPHRYQQKGIKFCLENSFAGLLLSPGLGKTSIILAVFKLLKKQGLVTSMLVIAPLRACYSVWPKEIKKWKEFSGLTFEVLHGPKKNEFLKKQADILIVNYEGLDWLTEKGIPPHINMLVVDESSKVKDPRTRRFKILKSIIHKFKRRYILTGSPAANSLMDLFGQFFIMDGGKTFGYRFTHFRNTYFFSTGYGGYTWLPKPGADKQIFKAAAPRVLRMAAKDYLELPPLIIKDVEVTLPDKAMRIYKQMETILRVDFEEGRVIAANAAVASMKCRQIANGGVYLSESSWEHIHEAKSEVVADLVDELSGQPALISYDFLHDLERLRKVLGKDTPHIGGGVTATRGREIEESWNKGELRALLGHPQSIAHALNLQGGEEGGAIILHSLPWSFELYDQFISRIWRQGQKKRVVVNRIIALKTVDEAIIKSLERKDRTQNAFFDSLKEYLDG